jgi:hypothetical protein
MENYKWQAPRCGRRCRPPGPGRQAVCQLGSRQQGRCRLACVRTSSRGTGSRCCSTSPVGRHYTCAASRPLCWRRRRSKRSRALPRRRTRCCPGPDGQNPVWRTVCHVHCIPIHSLALQRMEAASAQQIICSGGTAQVQHCCATGRTGRVRQPPKQRRPGSGPNGPTPDTPPQSTSAKHAPASRRPRQLAPASRRAGWLGARSAPPCDTASCRQMQHTDVSATSASRQRHINKTPMPTQMGAGRRSAQAASAHLSMGCRC